MLRRRSIVQVLFAVAALSIASVSAGPAAHAAESGADGFIKKIGKEAIDSLTGQNLSDAEREKRFRAILKRSFNVKLIARFTLGRYWRRATKKQQEEYVGLFEDFIVQAYAARFKDYKGEKFEVSYARDINERDKLVLSNLNLTDGRTIPVHWRVRGNSDYKVIDVLVEGISMAITQRDEFSAIINQKGGKVEGLLVALREKTRK